MPRKTLKDELKESLPLAQENPPAEATQKPLFGEADMVLNTLEMELKEIEGDMKKCRESIERLEEKEAGLQTRFENVFAAKNAMLKLRASP